MTITLPPPLESALSARAAQRGLPAEELVLEILRERLAPPTPGDEWEQRLSGAARDCGVSVPDSALSSDGLYE